MAGVTATYSCGEFFTRGHCDCRIGHRRLVELRPHTGLRAAGWSHASCCIATGHTHFRFICWLGRGRGADWIDHRGTTAALRPDRERGGLCL